jgi:hypothetical protein
MDLLSSTRPYIRTSGADEFQIFISYTLKLGAYGKEYKFKTKR